MIQLASECLVFQNPEGDLIPCASELVSVELVGGADLVDPDILKHAAASVLHYFKVELCRDTVTLGEFSEALEKVLRKFGVSVQSKIKGTPESPPHVPATVSSLARLASEVGSGGELAFFPRLREAVRDQLEQTPRLMYFSDLRACVKQLTGARRWSRRCRVLGDQIVEFLRDCVSSDHRGRKCSLVVR